MKDLEVIGLSKVIKVKAKEKGIKGSLKNIIKPKYKEIKAVDNISFSVEKGEILAFIGPNGARKVYNNKNVNRYIAKYRRKY